jgi:hypothetical protein
MSPLAIEILLHYHCTPGDYRNGDFSAPAVRELIDWMHDEDLIAHKPDGGYTSTSRLTAVVKKLCSVDLPEMQWVYPEDLKD